MMGGGKAGTIPPKNRIYLEQQELHESELADRGADVSFPRHYL
jgi:hypothetical protein